MNCHSEIHAQLAEAAALQRELDGLKAQQAVMRENVEALAEDIHEHCAAIFVYCESLETATQLQAAAEYSHFHRTPAQTLRDAA